MLGHRRGKGLRSILELSADQSMGVIQMMKLADFHYTLFIKRECQNNIINCAWPMSLLVLLNCTEVRVYPNFDTPVLLMT